MIGPILFQISSFRVYTHGFFLMLGVIFASIVLYWLANKFKYNKSIIFDLIIYTLLFGIIGARITYFILYRSQFESALDLFKIWQGGLVSWGGFIFGIAAAAVVLRLYKEKTLPWLDILLVSSVLGLAIGRLGSFLSGELAGLPSSGTFAISGVYPITLYEAIFDFIIFLILIFICIKYKNVFNPGILSLDVIMLYSLGRFIIDFWRAEEALVLGLSLGQIFSAIVFIASFILFFIIITNRRVKNAIN
jgi:phosphatidylglycerol:prolipoprotein diacylglycerol transferase